MRLPFLGHRNVEESLDLFEVQSDLVTGMLLRVFN